MCICLASGSREQENITSIKCENTFETIPPPTILALITRMKYLAGGGGPGVGSIGVAKHLAPYLPGHSVVPCGGSGANTVTKVIDTLVD